ncbi:cell cycle regulator of non-homologous end joining isoform X1 [Canis aureus]
MEAVKSGDKKRVLPAWMTTQETPKPKRAVQGAAAARLPAMRTAYCMSEAEMVDVALGILIEDFPKLASTTVVCIFVKYGVKQPPTWSAQELPAASLTRHQVQGTKSRVVSWRGVSGGEAASEGTLGRSSPLPVPQLPGRKGRLATSLICSAQTENAQAGKKNTREGAGCEPPGPPSQRPQMAGDSSRGWQAHGVAGRPTLAS